MNVIALMNLYEMLSPAILSYEGIQYQYMAPVVFTDSELEYVQNHLRILSGFYGVFKTNGWSSAISLGNAGKT